ncbi:MAG: 6-phosphogluconolactonase [Chitinophagaceae bacterium]
MAKKNSITIWPDHEAASLAAAHRIVFLCSESIAKRGRFTLALSGGNTPARLFDLLSSASFRHTIEWDKVLLFWSDERFVPHDHEDSNYRMAKTHLLSGIPVPAANIYPIPTDSDPKKNAKEYEHTIRSSFGKRPIRFDCILLGMGTDGHTASLFPGTAILKEKKRLISEVWVEEKKTWRISFTLPLINEARQILFLVTGKDKAAALNKVWGKKQDPSLPARLVKGNVSWITDESSHGRE